MNADEPAKNEDGQENEQYEKICELIWSLKNSVQNPVPDGATRKAVFPPVRRTKVALLIVGQSPNHNGVPYNGNDREQTMEHAKRYEFIRRPPRNANDYYNHSYYEKLICLVRQVDKRLGVWWEIPESKKELLVEFADALPLATIPGGRDFSSVIQRSGSVRESCKIILSAILDYYAPRVILANGEFAGALLRELHAQNRNVSFSTSTCIVAQNCQRQIHLSGFIDYLDKFSRDRLVAEMKAKWPYRNGS